MQSALFACVWRTAVLALCSVQTASAAVKLSDGTMLSEKPYNIITHVDIVPPEQFPPCKRQVSESGYCGNALVESLVKGSRGQKGELRFDALTQASRPNHMAVIEMSDSAKEQGAHEKTKVNEDFRDGLDGVTPGSGVNSNPLFIPNPLTGSLYDERLYKLL